MTGLLVRIESRSIVSMRCLDCFGNCEAILQLLELCRRGLVQIIDLACVGRNEGMQLFEFLGVRQLFREHDLANLIFNGHGSIWLPIAMLQIKRCRYSPGCAIDRRRRWMTLWNNRFAMKYPAP